MTRPLSLVVAALAVFALSACDGAPGRPDEADRYRRPSEIMDFATLYGSNCAGCHGDDGTHGPARPLADPVYLSLIDPLTLASIVSNGVPGTSMPAFATSQGGSLEVAQVTALADQLFATWGSGDGGATASRPPHSEAESRAAGFEPGDPERGRAAFGKFCADCHGPGGRGERSSASSVVDPSLLSLVSDQMLRTSIIAGRPDLGMPDWRKLSKERAMTPQEVSDVVAWLVAQRPRIAGRTVETDRAFANAGEAQEGRGL